MRQHKTLQKYYWACMDWYEIVTQGLSVPQEFLGYITGRWHYIRKMQKKIKAEEEMPKEWNEEEVSMYAEGTRKLAEADVWVFAKYEPVKHEVRIQHCIAKKIFVLQSMPRSSRLT